MSLRLLAQLVSLSIAASACLKGPSLFKKDKTSSGSYDIIASEIDGGVSGAYDPSLGVTQTLSASAGSAIEGASVSFPPGALAIDNTIRLEEGASLASSATASAFGAKSLSSAGPAVVLSSSIAIDGSKSFTMSVPKSKTSSLALASEDERLVIVYRVLRAGEKQYYTGVYTRDQLTVDADKISFNTTYFGSYQAVVSDSVITKAVSQKTTAPILTKSAEAKLPEPTWTLKDPSVNASSRVITTLVSLSEVEGLVSCVASTFTSKTDDAIASKSITRKSDLSSFSDGGYTISYETDSSAHSFYFNVSCIDLNGRSLESPWSTKATIAAKSTANGNDDEPVDLAIVGYGDPATTPDARRIDGASNNEKTISGTCDSNAGGVHVRSDTDSIAQGNTLTVSCTNNTFSFTINGHPYTADITLDQGYRGYEISIWQAGQEVSTRIFSLPSGSSIVMITNAADLSAITGSGYYVFQNDITLTGNWTPKNSFTGVLDGDGHTLSGLNLLVSSATLDVGLISSTSGANVGHMTIDSPSITGSTSSAANQVGFVMGSENSCIPGGCIIAGVKVVNGAINISGQGADYMGGLVGKVYDVDARIYASSVDAVINNNTGTYVGGIAGYNMGDITAASSSGSIAGKANLGGVVGVNLGTVRNSSSTMSITTMSTSGAASVGGLVGVHQGGQIMRSFATGDIIASYTIVGEMGGLVGNAAADIIDSYATGNVSGGSSMGGLVGNLSAGNLHSVYANGNISGTGSNCGGLIGESIGTGVAVTDAFAAGSADCTGSSSAYTGGLIGKLQNSLTNDTSTAYVNGSVCSRVVSMPSCTAVSSTLLTTPNSTYYTSSSWDFLNTWTITSGYLPKLSWEE